MPARPPHHPSATDRPPGGSRRRAVGLAAACLAAVGAAPSSAMAARPAQAELTVAGAPAPGPDRFDRVPVTRIGDRDAGTVLVLVPGTAGGRGDFTLVARDLVRRVPDLQVWAVDRRTQAFEDTRVAREGLARRRTAREVFDHYVGWLADPTITDRYRPLDPATVPFTTEWGLAVQMNDLRRVVRRAGADGRRVVLGGHSLGASVAASYAAWDFGGRPGHRDLAGMVLIDGGLLGTFTTPDPERTRQRLSELRASGQPFLDLLGLGLPWAAGAFSQTAALAAVNEPRAPSVVQTFPLLPPAFKPPRRATNRGALGYAFDRTTSPEALSLIRVRAGRLATRGFPRDWVSGEVSPISRVARTFADEPNAVEWYFPRRLSIDVDAASPMRDSAIEREVGLRQRHLRSVRTPLYAIQTDLTDGRVLRGARRYLDRSASPRSRARLVDASRTDSHLDPLTATPRRSRFVRTVVPWLRGLPGR